MKIGHQMKGWTLCQKKTLHLPLISPTQMTCKEPSNRLQLDIIQESASYKLFLEYSKLESSKFLV